MILDAIAKVIVLAAEAEIKRALTEGIEGVAPSVMTPAQYELPQASACNRSTAAGVLQAIRTNPLPLATFLTSSLPPASNWPGCIVYCTNGAGGAPILAFSDGVSWLRSDTAMAVS